MKPTMLALVLLFGLSPSSRGGDACHVRTVDDPLSGRVIVLGNEKLEFGIAPQFDRPFYTLRPTGGPELLKESWAWSEESVECVLDGTRQWLGGTAHPGTMEMLAARPDLSAARWRNQLDAGGRRLDLVRRVAIGGRLPAVFFEAVVHNRSDRPLPGVSYHVQLAFERTKDLQVSITGEKRKSFDAAQLGDAKLRQYFDTPPAVVLRRGDYRLEMRAERPANVMVFGGDEFIRLQLAAKPEDLGPHGRRTMRMVWTLAGGLAPSQPKSAWDWSDLKDKPRAVEPLATRDCPPPSLVPSRVVSGQGCYGTNAKSGPEFLPLWAAAGVGWQRNDAFSWGKIELRPGQLDFAATDRLVAASQRTGVALIGLVMSAPPWTTRDGTWIGQPKDSAAWEHFIETMIRRYRGRVRVWEIWNEPDCSQFWSGAPEDYVALLAAAYHAAKRADPECLVMSAGPDGGGERFLQRILALGAARWCDLVGFHPYGATPAEAEKRMHLAWRILNFYRVAKPIWITEVGWQSGGWKEGVGVVADEQTKARYLTDAFARLRPLAEVTCWYVDMEPGAMFGLIRPRAAFGFESNPAYEAFRTLARSMPERGGQPAAARVRFELPASVVAPAGTRTLVKAHITNAHREPFNAAVEAVGLPAAQVKLLPPHAELAPNAAGEFTIAITPSRAMRSGKQPLLLACFAGGRLVLCHS